MFQPFSSLPVFKRNNLRAKRRFRKVTSTLKSPAQVGQGDKVSTSRMRFWVLQKNCHIKSQHLSSWRSVFYVVVNFETKKNAHKSDVCEVFFLFLEGATKATSIQDTSMSSMFTYVQCLWLSHLSRNIWVPFILRFRIASPRDSNTNDSNIRRKSKKMYFS